MSIEGTSHRTLATVLVLAAASLAAPLAPLRAQEEEMPAYLADRGRGIQTSLFGTYIRKGELLFYPFYEYVRNTSDEYTPSELGALGQQEFLGTSVENEYLLFLAYGISDRLAVELEGAVYADVSLDKDPLDTSGVPDRIEESGLGEVEAQLRWRWRDESVRRPELFSFFEVVFPFQERKLLLGAQDWEAALGLGAIRGYRWGTLAGRVSVAYEAAESQVEFGEYAIEYLKKTSPRWRFVATVEGEDDEVALIGEAQWAFRRNAFFKFNTGFGLTEKAPDFAPEVGVLITFGRAGEATDFP
jgi:hypothetical protein